MTIIAIITLTFCLIFLVAYLALMLADKTREVCNKWATDYVNIWSKYHKIRIEIQRETNK